MEGMGFCLLLAFTFPFFCIVWLVVLALIKPKPFWLWMAAAVPVYVVVFSGFFVAADYYRSLPNVIFRSSFGFSPTADIQIINSTRHWQGDFDDTYLEFCANESTINKIISDRFIVVSAGDIIEYSSAPKWWKPRTGSGVRIYATIARGATYFDENYRDFVKHQLLIYDPVGKKAFYRQRQ
jgi:hypothetical protein